MPNEVPNEEPDGQRTEQREQPQYGQQREIMRDLKLTSMVGRIDTDHNQARSDKASGGETTTPTNFEIRAESDIGSFTLICGLDSIKSFEVEPKVILLIRSNCSRLIKWSI